MLDLSKSTIRDVNQYKLHSTITALEEGTAMVFAHENGEAVVKPSAGSGGEVFAGFAQHRHLMPTQNNDDYVTTIPASSPYTVTLPKTPIGSSSVKVYIAGTAATQGSVADNVYSISGNVLTFHSADAGLSIRVLYRYALTVSEANMLFGGESVSAIFESDEVRVSCISTGIVYLDNFVIADSWESPAAIYLGASGKLTLASGGTQIDAVVAATPSAANGMLGIALKP